MGTGFDNEKYLKIQSEHIKERISKFGDKLYLEFGGKLFDDLHASRVLPGFEPDSKLKMLMQLRDLAAAISAFPMTRMCFASLPSLRTGDSMSVPSSSRIIPDRKPPGFSRRNWRRRGSVYTATTSSRDIRRMWTISSARRDSGEMSTSKPQDRWW